MTLHPLPDTKRHPAIVDGLGHLASSRKATDGYRVDAIPDFFRAARLWVALASTSYELGGLLRLFLVRVGAVAACCALLRAGAGAKAIDESSAEVLLGAPKLVGVWECAGTGDGARVNAVIRWFHIEDGSLSMTLHPLPDTKRHPAIMDGWSWDDESATMGYRQWRTTPDPTLPDQASYTSAGAGFKDGKMVWVRHAAGSTMSRTFAWAGPDRLRFTQSYGEPSAPHVVYDLVCRRTHPGEPAPR
jgi:hypothetical protein